VVDERRGDDVGRSCDPLGEIDVFPARRGIAARVVVDEDEPARAFAQRDAEGVARRDGEIRQASRRDTARGPQSVRPVEREEPELFVIERREVPVGPGGDRRGLREAKRRRPLARDEGAAPELDPGRHPRRLGSPDASSRAELPHAGAGQSREVPVLLEQVRREGDDRLQRRASSEEESQELVVGQRLDADVHQAFTRSEAKDHADPSARGVPAAWREKSSSFAGRSLSRTPLAPSGTGRQ
jgi:hypothetical protein